jgi:hypothetical protein
MRVFAARMLAARIIEQISSHSYHPGDLGALGHVVETAPGDDQHLLD